MTETTLTPFKAPCCGEMLETVSELAGDFDLTPGLFTVCGHCGTLCQFDGDLSAHTLTPGELASLNSSDPTTLRELLIAQRAVLAAVSAAIKRYKRAN